MECRDEVLNAVQQIIKAKGINEFTIQEVVSRMINNGTNYKDGTIRTHIVSRLCANAPDNHNITYDDFERISRGIYKLL